MPTLAPKLPWTHAFAGGYPRVAGQALPTDPDAIDYLSRVAAADGAAVEVGVAMAIDAFIKGCKADGIWSAIKASCILCGARTISGALVPLVGAAPTGYGDWASGDYDRSSGLKGNGSTKYLNSNRANNADGQDDFHAACFAVFDDNATTRILFGARTPGTNIGGVEMRHTAVNYCRPSTDTQDTSVTPTVDLPQLIGCSRSPVSVGEYKTRISGTTTVVANTSGTPVSNNIHIFTRNDLAAKSNARLAFYSIGSALDLAALDNRVSTLVSAIAAAI